MWVTENGRTNPAKRPKTVVSLDKHIQDARHRFASQRAEIPELRKRVEHLRSQAATFDKRYQIRMRKDYLIEAEAIESEIQTRESMVR